MTKRKLFAVRISRVATGICFESEFYKTGWYETAISTPVPTYMEAFKEVH
jgi:hypothetical protein